MAEAALSLRGQAQRVEAMKETLVHRLSSTPAGAMAATKVRSSSDLPSTPSLHVVPPPMVDLLS